VSVWTIICRCGSFTTPYVVRLGLILLRFWMRRRALSPIKAIEAG
jgi:hypothetical protein